LTKSLIDSERTRLFITPDSRKTLVFSRKSQDTCLQGVPPVHGRRHHKTKSLQGADLSLYLAFKWCADFGKEWYLPALNELKAISANKSKLNKILSK
jgi:hypothetical protein